MTFEELLEYIRAHQEAYPTHGHNCTCMDEAIREFRKIIAEYKDYRNRIEYVVNAAMRHWSW